MNVVPRSTMNTNGEWVYLALIYTSELILCFTLCVHSATRHNIHINMRRVGRIRDSYKNPRLHPVVEGLLNF